MPAAIFEIVLAALVAVPQLEHGGRQDDIHLSDILGIAPNILHKVAPGNLVRKLMEVKAKQHPFAPGVADAKAAERPFSAKLRIPLPAQRGGDQAIAVAVDQLYRGVLLQR